MENTHQRPHVMCSFVAQSHTPCNRCVRFAPTVASGHATLATKRTLLLTWAGLSPAGSHQLCLAHLFDHLVSAREQRRWLAGLRGVPVDTQIVLCQRLHGKCGELLASKNTVNVLGCPTVLIHVVSPIGDQAATWDVGTFRIDHR